MKDKIVEIIEWLQKQHEFTSTPKTNSNSLFYYVSERTYAMFIQRYLEQPEPEEEMLAEYANKINREFAHYSVRERSRMIDGFEAAIKELNR